MGNRNMAGLDDPSFKATEANFLQHLGCLLGALQWLYSLHLVLLGVPTGRETLTPTSFYHSICSQP